MLERCSLNNIYLNFVTHRYFELLLSIKTPHCVTLHIPGSLAGSTISALKYEQINPKAQFLPVLIAAEMVNKMRRVARDPLLVFAMLDTCFILKLVSELSFT